MERSAELAVRVRAGDESVVEEEDAGCVGAFGETLLHVAASAGRTEIARRILERGVVPIDALAFDGETAMFFALQDVEMVRLLMSHGASVHSVDSYGRSLLYRAAAHGTEQVAMLLLDAGADPSASDMHGENVLSRSIWTRKISLSTIIASRFPSCVSQPDNLGNTPLHSAAQIGCVETASIILSKGPNYIVNHKNKLLESPLFLAVHRRHLPIISLLIKNGARVNDRDSRGDSLLHIAVRIQISAIVHALLSSGADPLARNALGLLPIDLCRTKRHARVRHLLISSNPTLPPSPLAAPRHRDDLSRRNTKRRRKQFVSTDDRSIVVVEMLFS
jgi:ankyrin repeat protein